MSYNRYKLVRIFVLVFVSITVSLAASAENLYLAAAGIVIGMIAMFLVKKNVKELLVDEMIKSIAGKSALMAYSITVPTLALFSIILMFSNLGDTSSYYYNLGIILSYIVLFNIAIYSISYYFYKKNGQ
ncbi:MAG: DUF2178 domain-containing protein [Candidatus Pacebacteria bacterium]|nr:DUF2178 domain-containing protein [Candidatus Paceibacterota bacterium]